MDGIAYFDYGSPYSYLAWHRVQATPEVYPDLSWRPVSAGHIFRMEGGKPNALYPNMLRYNRHDLARWAGAVGAPFAIPPSFPTRTLEVARIQHVAAEDEKEADWIDAAFKAHWVEGKDLAESETLDAVARQVGIANALARSEAHKQRVIDDTQAAYEAGAPGVPYFVVLDDTFWGNDRLDWLQALQEGQAVPSHVAPGEPLRQR